ncbi:hypothetical protein SAMN05444372_109125 [Flavobacterium micromati]|uniref:Peptidase E n=1 Tax=Flavobacterium micromati TaxID=229205 RepID=A0A1M5MD80_9FLAO|nr:DUF6702 family protein [Flavobacterium micromati]SHG74849.1 hypothetical protein SAMN05444372_109125 [Flavobacterium micromati]
MKKIIVVTLFILLTIGVSSFGVHKFYVSLYQVDFAPEKKMLQITSRIFIDDLNNAIEKKFNKKIQLGSENETDSDLLLFKKYFNEKFTIKVNGQVKDVQFLSKEMEGDVLICYFKIKDIHKIKSLEVYNAVIIEGNSEQQNIMHFSILGVKNTLLFTESSQKGVIKK